MITGQLYFVAENRVQLMRLTQSKEFFIPEKYKITQEVKDLLYKGYEKDPKKRLTMREYISHPAFSYLQTKYGHLINISNQVQTNKRYHIEKQITKQVLTVLVNLRNNL